MTIPGSILVAEDDPALVSLLLEALREEGYAVQGMRSGTAALAALLSRAPDLALIDLDLPDLSGLDLVKTARLWGIDVPIVIMTARGRTIDALVAAEPRAILLKPFDLDELLRCVAQHIRRSGGPVEHCDCSPPRR